MKAAFIKEFGKNFVIEEAPTPVPGPAEVLVRVKASALCPGDLKIRAGRMPHLKLPRIPGHEVAGVVESVGLGVTSCNPGDRVVVYMYELCKSCPACRSGRENLCADLVRMGFETQGGHAEFVIVKEDQIVFLPDSISFKDAAAIPDAISTSLHAIRDRAKVKLADTVIIYGVGGLGMHGVQIARLAGCRVIAVARSQDKLDKAREFGATDTVNAREQDVLQEVMRLTGNRGVDSVIDYVVNQESFTISANALKKGGVYALVGSTDVSLTIPVGQMMFKEITVKGSLGMTKQCVIDAVDLIDRGLIHPYVTEEYCLDDLNKAAERLGNSQVLGRSVILF